MKKFALIALLGLVVSQSYAVDPPGRNQTWDDATTDVQLDIESYCDCSLDVIEQANVGGNVRTKTFTTFAHSEANFDYKLDLVFEWIQRPAGETAANDPVADADFTGGDYVTISSDKNTITKVNGNSSANPISLKVDWNLGNLTGTYKGKLTLNLGA